MANKTPLYQLLAAKLDEDPVENIKRRREAGETWRSIERSFYFDHQVDVTDVTLRAWLREAEQSATA